MASVQRIEFEDAARDEVLDAIEWHRLSNEEKARAFVAALDHTLKVLTEYPYAGERGPYETRHLLVDGFAYVVVYRVHQVHLQIIAVAHTSRRPGTGGSGSE